MTHRRKLFNALSTWVITLGGVGVIFVVAAIFVFIGYVTIPLWQSSEITSPVEVTLQNPFHAPRSVLGVDEYNEVGYAASNSGLVVSFDVGTGEIRQMRFAQSTNNKIAAMSIDPSHHLIGFGTYDGTISVWQVTFQGLSGNVHESIEQLFAFPMEKNSTIQFLLIRKLHGEGIGVAALATRRDGHAVIRLLRFELRENLFTGEVERIIDSTSITLGSKGSITSLAVDSYGRHLVAGTLDGQLMIWDVGGFVSPSITENIQVVQNHEAITALTFLLGEQSLVIGTSEGNLQSFTWVPDEATERGWRLVPLNLFDRQEGVITSIVTSLRNKAFITSDSKGNVSVFHQTSARTVGIFNAKGDTLVAVAFSPRSDAILTLTSEGELGLRQFISPHIEVSLGILFSQIQYEGYDKPCYMWQSSSGTDDTEPKLSLMPLLFGTVKGAFYALLFAFPVAILAAIYTALFAHPSVRNIIKPTVEIMAALPSVVIGFVAALWLAPFLEQMLAEVIFICILTPVAVLSMSLLWSVLPGKITGRLKDGSELVFILIGICLIGYLSVTYGPLLEQSLFGTSLKHWIVDTFGVVYDQRNSIVVGFAMGFAVIPIIFTISEDSLSSVPEHLKAGSLALGATRWQTATHVILPTASPGIFSAAMIGFGRAVGETMIVLMATGNTPIMDWSPFIGMRTLSANIAVELPEAPYLGTLYRVLFFSGLLLFLFTFVVNTVAELVRHRLRHRYSTI